MTFVAGAVIWAGYTLAWWGWLAVTDRVPAGQKDTFWWPSIRDLIVPGRAGSAVPVQLNKPIGANTAASLVDTSKAPHPTGAGTGDTGNVTAGLKPMSG